MGDLTKNISRGELVCHCGDCSFSILDYEPIINVIQGCCDHFASAIGAGKVKLIITSPARCQAHNNNPVSEGGAGSNDKSQHLRARAMDIQLFSNGTQISPRSVYAYFDIRFPDSCGIGLYDSFTHFDMRADKARW